MPFARATGIGSTLDCADHSNSVCFLVRSTISLPVIVGDVVAVVIRFSKLDEKTRRDSRPRLSSRAKPGSVIAYGLKSSRAGLGWTAEGGCPYRSCAVKVHFFSATFVSRLARCLGAYQFERLQGAKSPDLADQFPLRLPLRRTLAETFAQHVGARAEVFFFDDVEHGQRRFAGHRIARERAAKLAEAGRIHDIGASRDRGHGQTAGQRFGHRDQIGFESQPLAGK